MDHLYFFPGTFFAAILSYAISAFYSAATLHCSALPVVRHAREIYRVCCVVASLAGRWLGRFVVPEPKHVQACVRGCVVHSGVLL